MKSKQGILGMLSIALMTATLLLARPARTEAEAEKKSLYDRLGGAYPISMVVDDYGDFNPRESPALRSQVQRHPGSTRGSGCAFVSSIKTRAASRRPPPFP